MKSISCPSIQLHQYFTNCGHGTAIATQAKWKIFQSIDEIRSFDWARYIAHDEIWMQPVFLRAMELASDDMDFRYALKVVNGQPMMLACFQLINFPLSRLQSTPGEQNWWQRQMGKIMSNRRAKMLVHGNCFFSGASACWHAADTVDSQTQEWITEAAEIIRKKEKNIVGLILKDRLPSEVMQPAIKHRFHEVPAEPYMYLPIAKHWGGMDDYLLDMSSKYRQRYRSAMKKSAELHMRYLSAEDCRLYSDRLYELSREVMEQGEKFSMAELSESYFPLLHQSLGKSMDIAGYFLNGRLVAFMSLIHAPNRMEVHYIGYETSLNRDFKLYQRMLYDAVGIGIEQKHSEIGLGRTAMEIKSTIGAVGRHLPSHMRLFRPWLHYIAGKWLNRIELPEWTPRRPFKISHKQPLPQ